MTVSKQNLRLEAIRHRDRIDPASENADDACTLFFEAIKPAPGQVVALYWPMRREFDPGAIAERLLKAGIACALPVVRENTRELEFAAWDESIELKPGPYGILQPPGDDARRVEPDIVVVPLLAFDRRGNRLGYGGGYYDATLRMLRARKKIIAVGLAYAQQAVLFNLPADEHDERLDWVITPQKAHYYGG